MPYRFPLHICLALALLLTSRVTAATSSEVAQQLQQAQQDYRQGQYAQAATTLEALIEADPALAEAHRLLGHTYMAMGRPSQARAALVEALGRGRVTPDVVATLIRIDRQAGGREVAMLAELPLMSALEPEAPTWPLLWAEALRRAGRTEAAVGVLTALTRQHPADPQAWLARGNAELETGRAERAATSFETAYHLGAAEPRLPLTLARLCRQLDQPHAALSWYDRALAVVTESAERDALMLEQAAMRVAAGLPLHETAALERLAQAGEQTMSAQAADLLARAALQAGRQIDAARWWGLAVDRGLVSHEVLDFLGTHYFNRSEYELAAGFLTKRVAATAPDAEHARRLLILSLIETGRRDTARQHLQHYLARRGLDEAADQLIRRFMQAAQ